MITFYKKILPVLKAREPETKPYTIYVTITGNAHIIFAKYSEGIGIEGGNKVWENAYRDIKFGKTSNVFKITYNRGEDEIDKPITWRELCNDISNNSKTPDINSWSSLQEYVNNEAPIPIPQAGLNITLFGGQESTEIIGWGGLGLSTGGGVTGMLGFDCIIYGASYGGLPQSALGIKTPIYVRKKANLPGGDTGGDTGGGDTLPDIDPNLPLIPDTPLIPDQSNQELNNNDNSEAAQAAARVGSDDYFDINNYYKLDDEVPLGDPTPQKDVTIYGETGKVNVPVYNLVINVDSIVS